MQMKKFTSLIFTVLMAQCLSAQMLTPTVISSSGAFYSNATAMLSTTIGEMTMVETFASTNNFLTQGFQQPELLNVGIDQPVAASNSVIIYPNPAADVFTLSSNFPQSGSLSFIVYNALGQEVMKALPVETGGGIKNIHVNIKKLSPGIYFVKTEFTSSSHQNFIYTLKLTIDK